jgi:excinuclease ABC subunit A
MPGRFSFNVQGGRCEACSGDGTIKIEMHFLPDVYVPCEVCKGARYNRDTLDITFKGKTIADVLNMPVAEAVDFFSNQPVIARHMQTLVDVGLGYVRLGQSAPTLSGGEAQRVKLASELAKRSTGHTIYLLDEPTTGLHFEDVRRLLTVLSRLVDQGNTVLVIEHSLDVIKTADWLIDLGPEGGSGGGLIVAEGPPEVVAKTKGSYTGHYLKPMLGL